MGTDNPGIPADGEGPQRPVEVDAFYMDVQEVTNRQFQSFIGATGYVSEVQIITVCSRFSLKKVLIGKLSVLK